MVDCNYDRINCYNLSKYLETIIKYTKSIDNLLEKDKPDEAFKLVIQFLNIATEVNVDCDDEYSEGINKIIYYIEKLIIGKSKICYGRDEYYKLCRHIKDLYQLDCSSDYIIEMLKNMFPYYKTKKAFKEEILSVLNLDDKKKFEIIKNGYGIRNLSGIFLFLLKIIF